MTPTLPHPYLEKHTLPDGSVVTFRPIRPEDEPAMVRFHESLSERSVYLRYFRYMAIGQRVEHKRLTRICFVDHEREIVLVAETQDGEIAAVGRLSRQPGTPEAEFAVLVSDATQQHGVGTELLSALLAIGRREKIQRVFGHILLENRPMQEVCRRLSFDLRYSAEEGAVEASLLLT